MSRRKIHRIHKTTRIRLAAIYDKSLRVTCKKLNLDLKYRNALYAISQNKSGAISAKTENIICKAMGLGGLDDNRKKVSINKDTWERLCAKKTHSNLTWDKYMNSMQDYFDGENVSKIEKAIMVSKKMIADIEKKIDYSLVHDDWFFATELSIYAGGMEEILIVFEQAKG